MNDPYNTAPDKRDLYSRRPVGDGARMAYDPRPEDVVEFKADERVQQITLPSEG